jgi:hypothetical protein
MKVNCGRRLLPVLPGLFQKTAALGGCGGLW